MSEKEKNKKKKKEKIIAGIVGSTILIAGAIAGGVASIPKAEAKGEEEKEEENNNSDPSNNPNADNSPPPPAPTVYKPNPGNPSSPNPAPMPNRNSGNPPPPPAPMPNRNSGNSPPPSARSTKAVVLPPHNTAGGQSSTKVNLRTVNSIIPPLVIATRDVGAVKRKELFSALEQQVLDAVQAKAGATTVAKDTDYTYDLFASNTGDPFVPLNLTSSQDVFVKITAMGNNLEGETDYLTVTLPVAKTDLSTVTDLKGLNLVGDLHEPFSWLKSKSLFKISLIKGKWSRE